LTVEGDTGVQVFSPDGSQIAFRVTETSSSSHIDVMNVDGTSQHTISGEIDFAGFPAWSPDGESISFAGIDSASANFRNQIYSVKPDGSDLHLLVSTAGSATFSAWSPDGRWLAITDFESATRQGIYIVDVANGGMTYVPVPIGDRLDNYIAWSPTSDQIAYTASDHLYILDVTHLLNVELLEEMNRVSAPRWSPDGKLIVVAASQIMLGRAVAATQIYTINTQTWDVAQLTAGPNDYSPFWSLDGTQIAFMSARDGDRSAIYIMGADGSNLTPIAQPENTDNVLPVWSR
jgi:TolB protein